MSPVQVAGAGAGALAPRRTAPPTWPSSSDRGDAAPRPGAIIGPEMTLEADPRSQARNLLRQLAESDEASLRRDLVPAPIGGGERACDEAVAAVLVAAGPAAGCAQLVASAPRLALALGLEP
jgi:hypothetical protein